jgi:hypothetical protein
MVGISWYGSYTPRSHFIIKNKTHEKKDYNTQDVSKHKIKAINNGADDITNIT